MIISRCREVFVIRTSTGITYKPTVNCLQIMYLIVHWMNLIDSQTVGTDLCRWIHDLLEEKKKQVEVIKLVFLTGNLMSISSRWIGFKLMVLRTYGKGYPLQCKDGLRISFLLSNLLCGLWRSFKRCKEVNTVIWAIDIITERWIHVYGYENTFFFSRIIFKYLLPIYL